MTDSETITVALLYAAIALAGPFVAAMLMRWSESQDAANLAAEIAAAIESMQEAR